MMPYWVYRGHGDYTYLRPNGWQFIPAADVAALISAGCIASLASNPARYLPMPNRDPIAVTPGLAAATPCVE